MNDKRNVRRGRTVVLKLKTKEFYSLTRSLTPPNVPTTCEEFTELGLRLCSRVDLNQTQLYRLVEIGLSNFEVEADADSQSAPLIDLIAASS